MKEIKLNYTPSEKQKLAHSDSHLELLYGGAIGGGKSKFLCIECFMLSVEYPGNRGFLGRKVGRHFRETTLITWKESIPQEFYTINEQKHEIKIRANGRYSYISYGGLNTREDIDKFTSAEYGFIAIDQAEELTESDYLALLPRLRKKLPDGNQPHYRALFTANPKACFLRQKFIVAPGPDQKFIQALPSDNPHLPGGYIERVKEIYKYRPELLKALIEGSWDLLEGIDVIIKWDWANQAKNNTRITFGTKTGVSVDASRFGDDETVIYGWIGTRIVKQDIFGQKSTMETAGRALTMCNEIFGNWIAVEGNGLGGGVADRLKELTQEQKNNIQIIEFDANSQADSPEKYGNKRAEAWWEAGELFADGVVGIGSDDVLVGQLSGVKYRYNSGGRIFVEAKEDIKAELGQSPDRADCCVIGLYAIRRAPELTISTFIDQETSTQKWVKERELEMVGVASSYQEMEN